MIIESEQDGGATPKDNFCLPEFTSELVYSDLLSKILLYDQNISC
jgi:hypothetical protein